VTELLQFTIFGLILGCVYAIASMGLVLTYTVTGVFNFAHGAVGMIAAFVYFQLRVKEHVPTPLALLLVIGVFAPLAGLVAERLLRRFQGTDYATSLVVTIALTVGLLGLAQKVFPDDVPRNMPFLFGNHKITVASVPISYDRIAQLIIAIVVAAGLRQLLYGTGLGARMRAVVDDPELARLNGVRSVAVARYSWMIGFALAGLGGVLVATGNNVNAIVLTLLVLNAYGAAMIGRLTSLPWTFVGALALGLISQLTNVHWLWPAGDQFARISLAIPGLFLVLAVLLVPSIRLSAGRIVGRDQPDTPSLRTTVLAGALVVLGVLLVVDVGPSGLPAYVSQALVIGLVALSLVTLTGLSGQVSLTQYLFLGLGAFIAAKTFGGDSVFGMLLGGLVAAGVGVIAALPSVRLRGLHLALSTFGIALIGREAVLADPHILGLHGISLGRPHVLGLSTNGDAAFAVWCAVVFVVFAILVGVVRRSWFGRQLTAIRDSELAAATLGLRVRWAKVGIFALSAFIAGCAGSLFGGINNTIDGTQFEPVNSLVIVLFAFVGGITTVSGAALAGSLFAVLTYAQATFPELSGIVFLAIGAAAISLGRQPDGIAGVLWSGLRSLRDDPRGAWRRLPRPATRRSAASPSAEAVEA
jgi:branched-chain amino acid transport system permease protein